MPLCSADSSLEAQCWGEWHTARANRLPTEIPTAQTSMAGEKDALKQRLAAMRASSDAEGDATRQEIAQAEDKLVHRNTTHTTHLQPPTRLLSHSLTHQGVMRETLADLLAHTMELKAALAEAHIERVPFDVPEAQDGHGRRGERDFGERVGGDDGRPSYTEAHARAHTRMRNHAGIRLVGLAEMDREHARQLLADVGREDVLVQGERLSPVEDDRAATLQTLRTVLAEHCRHHLRPLLEKRRKPNDDAECTREAEAEAYIDAPVGLTEKGVEQVVDQILQAIFRTNHGGDALQLARRHFKCYAHKPLGGAESEPPLRHLRAKRPCLSTRVDFFPGLVVVKMATGVGLWVEEPEGELREVQSLSCETKTSLTLTDHERCVCTVKTSVTTRRVVSD